ncbi:DUF1206 domain-containing protein [Microbacterium sp. Yaish 1]|uniref:DUF1206 domain-containing protein n=1 Tax=Microbacterium sp. Yaish 1 TaxID=2025014 RepID=UPI000B93B028|nr:DUF1206 domain-containing protein [Microbacterium sp. Yaish 1]OYC97302.1 hypothetical protein CI089_01750 [Microbacterium sp. Yaish 1]
MAEHGVHDAASAVERHPAARALARGGYVANGFVHLLIGSLIVAVAFGGERDADQTGAFRAVAELPLGFVALWAAAALLTALGVWHLAEGMLASRRRRGAAVWGLRVSEWGQAVVFLFFGGLSAAVALGARPQADESARDASRGILALPGGVFAIVLVGIGVAIAGVVFVVMGVRRSFHTKMTLPGGAVGRAVEGLGVVGFIAKGIALGSLGGVLIVAAVRSRADEAGSLDAAIRALLDLTFGPEIVVVVGAGLIAYGVFTVFRARYADL